MSVISITINKTSLAKPARTGITWKQSNLHVQRLLISFDTKAPGSSKKRLFQSQDETEKRAQGTS